MKKRKEKVIKKKGKSENYSINKRKNSNINLKSAYFRIFTYFKNNKYNDISLENTFSKLIKEYDSNPNNFLTAKNAPYNSKKNFISCLALTFKNNSFTSIIVNNKKHMRLNTKNALDYLQNLYNRNQNKKSSSPPPVKYPKKSERKKNNKNTHVSNNNNNFNHKSNSEQNSYIGKKRKRSKINEEGEEESIELSDLSDIENKSYVKIKKDKNKYDTYTTNSDNMSNSNNTLYFQGEPYKKNLSNLTFNEYSETNKNIFSYNITDSTINYDKISQQSEYNITLLLYHTKEE